MSKKTFQAVFPLWREELALQYRAAAGVTVDGLPRGYKPTAVELAELRAMSEIQFLEAIGPAMKKEMGSQLLEEACCIAGQAFVERLLELCGVTTISMKH